MSGVWCPALRPLSASAAHTSRGHVDVRRPFSAPAYLLRDAPQNPDLVCTELPAPDFPIPSHLPDGITANWLTRLLYDGNHLEPRSGIIVSTVDEITDIYCDNGCVLPQLFARQAQTSAGKRSQRKHSKRQADHHADYHADCRAVPSAKAQRRHSGCDARAGLRSCGRRLPVQRPFNRPALSVQGGLQNQSDVRRAATARCPRGISRPS